MAGRYFNNEIDSINLSKSNEPIIWIDETNKMQMNYIAFFNKSIFDSIEGRVSQEVDLSLER